MDGMTLGGLFSGIGGFELAAVRAGVAPVWSNEIDPYCCKVLRKNFSHEIIEADIRECGTKRKNELRSVDIICGGFPCQPFSAAGKRKGKDDNRYLWPEMLRTIREVKPTWVVGENVANITSMDSGAVFEEICASLENEGYQVETYIIPACAVGAPHRRDRVWIVANSSSIRRNKRTRRTERPHENIGQSNRSTAYTFCQSRRTEGSGGLEMDRDLLEEARRDQSPIGCKARNRNVTHTTSERCREEGSDRQRSEEWITEQDHAFTNSYELNGHLAGSDSSRISQQQTTEIQGHSTNPDSEGLEEWKSIRGNTCKKQQTIVGEIWQRNWMEVATGLCRVDDGLPAWVDSSRTNRLKALGNAIVPQVAQVIFEAILEFEKSI